MFLRHAGQKRRDQSRHACGCRERDARTPAGFRLCGIVDDPPPGSAASATSNCISSVTSRAILPSVPQYTPQAVTSDAKPVALRMPRRAGVLQAQLARQVGGDTRAVRSPSAASVPAAPPNCSTRVLSNAENTCAPARDTDANQPGGFQPKRDRRRRLQQRAAEHDRVAHGCRTSRRNERRQPRVIRLQNRRRAREAEDERRVDHDPGWSHPSGRTWRAARSKFATRAMSASTSGIAMVADCACRARDGRWIERDECAARGDRVGRGGGDDAGARFGARQRNLELQHRGKQGAIRKNLGERLGRDEALDEPQTHPGPQMSKNTVSCDPCSRTWKSQRPGDCGSGTGEERLTASRRARA